MATKNQDKNFYLLFLVACLTVAAGFMIYNNDDLYGLGIAFLVLTVATTILLRYFN